MYRFQRQLPCSAVFSCRNTSSDLGLQRKQTESSSYILSFFPYKKSSSLPFKHLYSVSYRLSNCCEISTVNQWLTCSYNPVSVGPTIASTPRGNASQSAQHSIQRFKAHQTQNLPQKQCFVSI